MRMTLFVSILIFLPAAASAAPPQPVLTKVPFTYILDYGRDHINSPAYIEKISQAPPTLLHLGKDVPFTHNWGPIQALGGENQAYGKRRPYADEDFIRRLSPKETGQRVADLTRLAGDLHKAGVKWVTPYICSMTIGGHPERRAGFWEFYDHWDEYQTFGLGPRPATDPVEWLQRTPAGKPLFFYQFEGPFYPAYEPNIRYAVCQNRPEWRSWTERLVENIAKCGFDGVFVDNAGSLRCYCSACREKWRAWIDSRYTPAERQKLFGTERPEMSDGKQPGLLRAETQRFWCDSLAEHLKAIAEAGRRVTGKPFVVFPNGGERRPENILHIYPDTDLIMFERSVGPNGTHPGMVLRPVVEEIRVKKYNDNVFEYKFVQCLRRNVRPILLTRPGYQVPRAERLLLEMNADSAALGNAEAAAFGGGGGFLQHADARLMQVQKQYRDFFEQNAALYEGLDSLADVAVAVLPDLAWLDGNDQHQREVRKATQHLLDGHVLFDYLIADQLAYDNLTRYAAVVLPRVTHLAERQIQDLNRYVEHGGVVIGTGLALKFNDKGQPLASPPMVGVLDVSASSEERSIWRNGKGTVVSAANLPAEAEPLIEWLETAAGRKFSVLAGPATPAFSKVRVNVFRAPGAARSIVHLVNYNVPLGVEKREPQVQGPIEVTLRLGDIPSVPRVRSFDPQGPSADLSAEVKEGELRFTLPELRIYKAVEITAR